MWERRLRVLVVDDDEHDVELLRRQLSLIPEWKSEVHHVIDADGTTAQMERRPPDAVFVDFRLGAKSGIDIVKMLRQMGYLTPVLMLTGQGNQSVVKECLISGADDYLDKNALDPETLRRGLQHANAQYLNRKAEVKLRLIQFSIDHASDPVWWVRADGRFAYANHAACAMLSRNQDDFLSLRASDITSSICRQGWQDLWKRIKQDGAATCEEALRAPDGSTIPVELRLNYVKWKHIERACVFVRDLRERRKIELQLREKEEQLRHKQRLEAVGSLAGGIAHEFNNLLQAIRGFTQYAMEGLPPAEQRHQDLEQVVKAADRAAELTRQLLGFSRKQVLERVACDPNEIVTDLTRMLRPLIGERISLQLSLDPDAGHLFADRHLLLQMLLNLCINARDAMPDGGRLTMATQRIVLERDESDICSLLQPGSYVTFTVTDTGCGMPPEVKDRVFEPFFTTKGIGKGTGLGLAMVYGAVQQHDGTIDVTSEPGAGTSFKIMLPTAVSCEIAVDQQPMRLAAGGRETILVAEDEPIVRDLAVRILTRAGYSVLAASDGEQAWQLFEAHTDRISLALLDAVMPKLTGRQVYERISHARPELPVVFSSGYDRETGQGKSFPDKRLRTVQKPYESETLLQAVRHALDEAQLPEASPCS